MKIGITELIVIFIVALFVIGPDKLPSYAKKLGEALAQFRKYSQEAAADIKESIVEPLEEAQRPLKEAVEPLQEIDREIRGNVKDVRDSFAGIGRPKKKTEDLKQDLKKDLEQDLTEDSDSNPDQNTESAPVSVSDSDIDDDIDDRIGIREITEAVLEKSGAESA